MRMRELLYVGVRSNVCPVENGLGRLFSMIEFGSLTLGVCIKWTQGRLFTQYVFQFLC